jgi:hypothetical protein
MEEVIPYRVTMLAKLQSLKVIFSTLTIGLIVLIFARR